VPKPSPFLDHVKARLGGENTPTPPGEPVSRDKMTAGISTMLRGGQAPRDITGDPTSPPYDQQANDGNQQTAEEEARAKLEQLDDGSEILAALDDPSDELHATAVRLLKAYTALVEQERKTAAQP
jgi:hypothetical protein